MGAAEALGGPEQNGVNNRFGILAHFAVPEPDHLPTFGLQEVGTSNILRTIRMLRAVDFHYQPCLATGEVRNIRTDRELPGEFRPIATEQAPDQAFGIGRAGAERPCPPGRGEYNPSRDHRLTIAEMRFAQPTPGPSLSGRG